MKLTKLIPALLLALAMLACSKKETNVDTDGGLPINPPTIIEGGTAENPMEVSPFATLQDGNLVLIPTAANTIDINKMVNVGDGNTIGANGFSAATTITGTPSDAKGAVTLTPDAGSNITLAYAVANYSATDITGQTMEIAVSKDGKYLSTIKVPIVIKATPLPDGFTFKTQAGHEFMHMTTRGTIEDDIAAFNYIKNNSPVKDKSFGEILMGFYLGGYDAGRLQLSGDKSPTVLIMGKLGATCPLGFRIPTEAEYASITGNTSINEIDLQNYGVWKGDGDGITKTRYRVISDDSGITTNFQQIRNVEFESKQMTIFYATSLAKYEDYGEAVQTYGGNNAAGVGGGAWQFTLLYKPMNIPASKLLTRCVKDKTASVIW